MNTQRYQNMLREFCRVHALEDAQTFIDTGAIHIDGMDMLLRYDEKLHPDALRLYLDLGMPPPGTREKLWDMLLISNFVIGEQTGGYIVFSVHPVSNHVVLSMQFHLVEDNAAFLLQLLKEASAEGQRMWKETLDALLESRQRFIARSQSSRHAFRVPRTDPRP